MQDLYIYYKVPEAQAQSLWPRVQAMQAALGVSTGVTGQLRRRPAAKEGRQTWMEIYPMAPAAFETALAQAVVDAGLLAAIEGARHTEAFTDQPPCA